MDEYEEEQTQNMFSYMKETRKRRASKENIISDYEKKLENLPTMLKNFHNLRNIKFEFPSEEIRREFDDHENMFENDFVTLHCEIQTLKAENQATLEDIAVKQELLGTMDRELIEKDKLIKYFEGKTNLKQN